MNKEFTKRKMDEQFGESTKGTYSGSCFQSSECPWMKEVREEGGPEPSCLDIDWGEKDLSINKENWYVELQRGGMCSSCRGFGHDENGLFVMCAAPNEV